MWTHRLASLAFGLLLLLAASLPGVQSLDNISGIVTDEGGQPLSATVASIDNNKIVKSTTTAEDGSFMLPLDSGVSKILVYSDDPSTTGFDYVPALVDVSTGEAVSVALKPAASLSIKGDMLFVDTDNIPTSYSLSDCRCERYAFLPKRVPAKLRLEDFNGDPNTKPPQPRRS